MNWDKLKESLNKYLPDETLEDRENAGLKTGGKMLANAMSDKPGINGEIRPSFDLMDILPPEMAAGFAGAALKSGVAAKAMGAVKLGFPAIMGALRKTAGIVPNDAARAIAREYMENNGLKELVEQPFAHVDPSRAAKIAQAYQDMPHDPNNPEVKKAYDALINETMAQYQKLKDSGLKIDSIKPGMENPYASGSKALMDDIRNNNHMYYYPTESGFGTEHAITDHPLLKPTSEMLDGKPLQANDLFRIVHDYFGHNKEGLSFGPRGEENAWREHMQMFSPEAQKALTTETRGQNSWVNFGPKGESNRANPGMTTYADQKAGIMPDWVNKPDTAETIDATANAPKSDFPSLMNALKDKEEED